MQILFVGSFTASSTRFIEFDAGNMILFQIKVYGRNIKGTTVAKYFIKVTARSSFTRLRVICRINRSHQILKWKISYKDSVVPPSYLNLLERSVTNHMLLKNPCSPKLAFFLT